MDDDLMIIGAKKKNNVKDYDKNDLDQCVNSFKKNILNGDVLSSRDVFVDICTSGDAEKNLLRPILWNLFLGILPFEMSIEEWVEKTVKNRANYKVKLKGLNSLKKFSGDPLGN